VIEVAQTQIRFWNKPLTTGLRNEGTETTDAFTRVELAHRVDNHCIEELDLT